MMKKPFLLSLLAASVALGGCSASKKPVELALEPQSQYDQRIQDGLGVQRYTEAQIIYQRQLNEFQGQIDSLNKQRLALEQGLNNAAYENDLSNAPASSAEAGRIAEFHDASRQTQAKIARSDAELSVKKALLENERDASLLEAERKATAALVDIEAEYSALTAMAEQANRELINARTQQEAEILHTRNRLRSKEAELLDAQRFELAVANAEKVTLARTTLSSAQADLSTSRATFQTEIAELEARLAALRNQSALVLAEKEAAVSAADAELQRLVDVGEMLKAKPSTSEALVTVGESPEFKLFVSDQDKRLADQKIDIERRKQARIAEVKNSLAAEKNLISSRTRTQIAGLESVALIDKAAVVAPVVTGRRVYTGEAPRSSAPSPAPAPIQKPLAESVKVTPVTVATFAPKLEPEKQPGREPADVILSGGSTTNAAVSAGAPVVVEKKTREVFDVLYVYSDKPSWEKFQNYLKAYGVSDFLTSRDSKKGEWHIYLGRYYDADSAARRIDELNRKTSTNHARVIRKELPR